ncbi:gag-pol polyprotein [Artemisia annua]|uniref:Gag-pol polyprotein n=1 Tax=Artemisia annua TaxID=35608 RepID=A0A2U1NCV3_ARTAN|nr:gag-pol polyprotein [Artemisia annua]
MPLEGIGSADTPSVALSDVYYMPNLTINLASVSKICDSEYDVKFSDSDCSIYDQKTQDVVGIEHRQWDLYVLDHFRDIHDTTSSSVDLSSFWLNRSSLAFYLWHFHLGHVSGSRLRFLASIRALEKLETGSCSNVPLAFKSQGEFPSNSEVRSRYTDTPVIDKDLSLVTCEHSEGKSILAFSTPNGILLGGSSKPLTLSPDHKPLGGWFLCMRYVIRGLDGISWYWIVLELMFGWILRSIIGTVLDQQIKRIGVQYFWLMAC